MAEEKSIGDADGLRSAIESLREQVRASTDSEDRVRQHAFDQLYEELRQYKEDFLFQAEKPLLLDLLLFHDSLLWFQDSLERGEMSQEAIVDACQYLVDEFLELLYRRDVVPIEAKDKFDRKIHKAVKVVDTDAPAQDYRVAQVLKRGFQRAGRQIRPEEVVIHRLRRTGKDGGAP